MHTNYSQNELLKVFSVAINSNNSERNSGAPYYNIFDFLKESIFVTDNKFNTIYINSAFEKTFDFKKKDIIGKILPIFLTKEFLEKKYTILKKLISQGKWEDEIKIENNKEADFNIHLLLNLLKNKFGKSEIIIGTCSDITELKQSDVLLNKRNSLLNLLNDVIKYTNRSNDINSSITYAIDKVCQYTLWDIGHCYLMINNRLVSTQIWNSNLDNKYKLFKNLTERAKYVTESGMPNKCLQQEKPIWVNLNELKNEFPYKRFEFIKNYKLNSGIWIPIMINKDVAGILEFFSNSEMSIDNEIMYSISNMCLELGSLIDRVETFNTTKVNEKLMALGRFSAGIAHELRNPLANISALSQLILKNETNDKNQKHLAYVIENTRIANKIITDLLNYTSPDELNLSYTDLVKFVNKILEITEPRFIERRIEIIKKISSKLPFIYIDEIKIENAIMNFLTNAMDAMPNGGLVKIEVKKRLFDDSISIIISDNGIGIPEENIDKIFEPFFSTKHTGTGLGMGLALQTIKSHGGTLNIKSKITSGTTVEIKLPIRKEEGNI